MLLELLAVVARHDQTIAAHLFKLQDSITMNKLTLKRVRLPTETERKAIEAIMANPRGDLVALDMIRATQSGDLRYQVVKVVGSISPYVGELLTSDHVKDLCDQTGIWAITFI